MLVMDCSALHCITGALHCSALHYRCIALQVHCITCSSCIALHAGDALNGAHGLDGGDEAHGDDG